MNCPVNIGSGIVLRDSGKALLVAVDDIGVEPVWIPKSVIHDDSEVWKEGQDGEVVVCEWFAEEKGWI